MVAGSGEAGQLDERVGLTLRRGALQVPGIEPGRTTTVDTNRPARPVVLGAPQVLSHGMQRRRDNAARIRIQVGLDMDHPISTREPRRPVITMLAGRDTQTVTITVLFASPRVDRVSGLVLGDAAHDGGQHADVADGHRFDGERVGVQHDEVGQLAHL